MQPDPLNVTPERELTDDSLNHERQRTDAEIRKRQAVIEEAGAVVDAARSRADDIVRDARKAVDVTIQRESHSALEREALERERAFVDAARNQERRAIDAQSQDGHAERLEALASLLRLEREQTNERLEVERTRADAAVSARDDFLGMVSHDLRDMLGGIALASSGQVKTAGEARDERIQTMKQGAERIQRFVARMNRLIGDLIDLGSIDAGRLEVKPIDCDVAQLVREAMESVRHVAAGHGLTLSTHVPNRPTTALADHGRVLQVLVNLLGNAIKFTDAGGTVKVSAEELGDEVRFSVADSGSGIAAEHLQAIFDRFWQVNDRDGRGVGLGLYIAKSIVERHGGRIWVHSEVGLGSVFSFTLPRLAPRGH